MKNILELPVPKTLETPKCFFESPLRWAFKKNYFYNENCCSDIIKTVIRLIYFKAQNGVAILCFENPYRV
jgi:hypothetical protein